MGQGHRLNRRAFLQSVAGVALASGDLRAAPAKGGWSAGAAAVDITPATSLWMAGYAARKGPSQGVALPLHAKALALRCGRQRPVVLVTCDLLGVTARISGRVADNLQKRRGVRRSEIFFNASHTHSGPVVDDQLSVAYDLAREQWDAIRAYTDRLEEMLTAVVLDALAHMRPARIGYARGEAGFAANRRVAFTPDGPADRSVPVLRVDASDGSPLAIVFGLPLLLLAPGGMEKMVEPRGSRSYAIVTGSVASPFSFILASPRRGCACWAVRTK